MHTATTRTETRLQLLLDEGDLFWFSRNPHERERIRLYFRNERMGDDAGEPARFVAVTQEDGRLVRRFTREGATA